ncbi:MAG: hypothetical protein JRN15_08505 [Nitrososphaerota archaeon]|nr:hypothetical protein [Nitrososphaerota archaeon]
MQETERAELINSLVIYGLSPVQAQAYITLLKLGRSTAKSISINSDINRVDVYKAVKRLSKLGLIEEILGNPIEFIAVEPKQALDILVESRSSQVDRLRSGKFQLEKRLELITSDRSAKDDSGEEELFVKILFGEQVFRRLKTMITNSKKEIIAVFSPKSVVLYDRIGVPELEEERVQNGVSVRAVTCITTDNLREASNFSRIVSLRHSDQLSSHLRYTIVDRSLLLLPVGGPPTNLAEATALSTDSNALITGLVDDFEKLWLNSAPAYEKISYFQAML